MNCCKYILLQTSPLFDCTTFVSFRSSRGRKRSVFATKSISFFDTITPVSKTTRKRTVRRRETEDKLLPIPILINEALQTEVACFHFGNCRVVKHRERRGSTPPSEAPFPNITSSYDVALKIERRKLKISRRRCFSRGGIVEGPERTAVGCDALGIGSPRTHYYRR